MTSANASRYKDATLSVTQRLILRRCLAMHEKVPFGDVVLDRSEVASGIGLERRGYLRTYRPMKGLFHRRPVKGSVRTARLTEEGLHVCKRLGLEPVEDPDDREPELTDVRQAARELAEAVLDDDSRLARNRARTLLELL